MAHGGPEGVAVSTRSPVDHCQGTLGRNRKGSRSAMTARKRGSGRRGGQLAAKGFRPGKEPVQLKKQRAKARLGSDASWLEKQTMEAVAGRSPGEVQAMVQKGSLWLSAIALAFAVAGGFLLTWNVWVGAVVLGVSVVLFFLAYRLRKQGSGLVNMAESLQ